MCLFELCVRSLGLNRLVREGTSGAVHLASIKTRIRFELLAFIGNERYFGRRKKNSSKPPQTELRTVGVIIRDEAVRKKEGVGHTCLCDY